MMKLKNTTVQHILLDADKGTVIQDCIPEAIALAMGEGVEVQVVHNNKRYTIDPRHIVDEIISHPGL